MLLLSRLAYLPFEDDSSFEEVNRQVAVWRWKSGRSGS